MNVVIANINESKLKTLDVDIIKYVKGEYSVNNIIELFSNFFFDKMFLDITAIKNYQDINTIKTLAKGFDLSKIILLLHQDQIVCSPNYISELIKSGFYNFTLDEKKLKQLYNSPNTFSDVAHLIINENPTKPKTQIKPIVKNKRKIIGFRNLTPHAGTTSLIYMLKKQLSSEYNTLAIEFNSREFIFFKEQQMLSIDFNSFNRELAKYPDAKIILLDLNHINLVDCYSICNNIIYLMESSTYMLNKMFMLDNKCFEKMVGKNIVLNYSLLSNEDLKQLQAEMHIKFLHVLPPLNDREDNSNILLPFLEKLNIYTSNENSQI